MGNQLRSQLLLNLSQSLPQSFISGMDSAERSARAAQMLALQKQRMAQADAQFRARLPLWQQDSASRGIQAATGKQNADLAGKKWDARDAEYEKKVRLAAAGKGPDATSAFNIGTGGDVAAEDAAGQRRKVQNTGRNAAAGAAARDAQHLKFLKDRHAAAGRGEVVESGPISNADFAFREEIKGKIRKEIQDAAANGRIDLAQAQALSKALLQEGDNTLETPIKDVYGAVPRPGAPAPAPAPKPNPNRQALVDQRAAQYLHQFPQMSEAEAIQRAEQEVQ